MDAGTRLVGVVGHPIGHTLSPVFWNAAFQHEGRNAVFLAFDVEPSRFTAFVDGMAAGGVRGLNVTMPHKRAAYELATERSPEAERTGAANVLVLDDDARIGANTDVHGVRMAVRDLELDPQGLRVLVLGAGGAASAAVYALTSQGAEVVVANRTRSKAEVVAEAFEATAVDWSDLAAAAADADLLVHAASVGMDGTSSIVESSVLEAGAKGRLRAVFDVVYAPKETALVHAARAAGLRACDGLGMLVHQAAETYRLFWDAPAPIDVMLDAARRAAGR
jgi:shikimate dehydrogenase